MYDIRVVSDDFKGVSLVKQHKQAHVASSKRPSPPVLPTASLDLQVKAHLADEIAEMHGLTLKTYTKEKYEKAVAKGDV